MAEELEGPFAYLDLPWVDSEPRSGDPVQHVLQVLDVVFEGFGVDQDVVKKRHAVLVFYSLEDLVHKGLKRSWASCHTERHSFELKRTLVAEKSCLGDIVLSHWDLEEPLGQVQAGKPVGPSQLGKDPVCAWHGVGWDVGLGI